MGGGGGRFNGCGVGMGGLLGEGFWASFDYLFRSVSHKLHFLKFLVDDDWIFVWDVWDGLHCIVALVSSHKYVVCVHIWYVI